MTNPAPAADEGDIRALRVWIACIALYAIYMTAALALPHEVLWQGGGRHPVEGQEYWELGLAETSQNIFLAVALIMAGVLCARAKPLLLKAWLGLVFIGILYLLGEETSWGQHYFRWGTEGWFAEVNDQQETNLHNTSALLDQLPRNLLYAGMIVGAIVHPLVKLVRSGRGVIDKPWWWAPTIASMPTALFAFIAGAPKAIDKIGEAIGAELPRLETYVGRASEMEECFMYFFFIVYLWSLAARLKQRRALSGA